MLHTKKPVEAIYRVRQENGCYRWVRGRAIPVLEPGGIVRQWVGHIANLTARRSIQRPLVLIQERPNRATKIADGLVWELDLATSEVRGSDGWKPVLGLSEEQPLSDEAFWALVHPDDRKRVEEARGQALRAEPGRAIEIEFRFRKPGDGGERRLRSSIQPLFDVAGRVIGLLSIANEVSTRRAPDQGFKESERALESMLANLPGFLLRRVMSADGQMSHWYVSPRIKEALGIEAEDVVSGRMRLRDLIPPEDRPGLKQAFQDSAAKLTPVDVTLRIVCPSDGHLRWFRDRSTPIRLEDGSVQWDGVVVDISEQKAAEERLLQLAKMAALGQLTTGVAHDFSNILTAILSSGDLLQDGASSTDATTERLVKNIQAAALCGVELTSQLLTFARPRLIELRWVEINKLMVKWGSLLDHSLGPRIRLKLMKSPLAVWANIDPAQFESCLLNLALNARDAMPEGGTLRIETSSRIISSAEASAYGGISPGRCVRIRVTDTGIGMSREVVMHATEPFYTTKPAGSGTGVGLSMVHSFVRRSGGCLRIASELGVGTEIEILLPGAEERPPDQVSLNQGPNMRQETPEDVDQDSRGD